MLEDLCSGFPWSRFVICCPSGWFSECSDWQPRGALPSSCVAWACYITILRHGPLPSHSTQAINTMTTCPSIPPLFAPRWPLLILVPVPTHSRKHWTDLPSWSVLQLCVTCYINMHVSVSWLEHQGPIFIESWSITGISLVIWAAPWCLLVRLNRVLGWNHDHFSIRIIDHSTTNYSAPNDLSDHCTSFCWCSEEQLLCAEMASLVLYHGNIASTSLD